MKQPIITEISFTPVRPRDTLLGFASVLYRSELRLSDIALHCTSKGADYTVVFPCKTLFNGARVNVYYPTSGDVGEAIRRAIIEKYLASIE